MNPNGAVRPTLYSTPQHLPRLPGIPTLCHPILLQEVSPVCLRILKHDWQRAFVVKPGQEGGGLRPGFGTCV